MIEFAPKSENQMSYAEAVLYCNFCDHDGYTDWRMPTLNEVIGTLNNGWYHGCKSQLSWPVTPVRDIC